VTFVASAMIQAPVRTVFAFHERDDALDRLLPPFLPGRVLHRTGGIRAGATVVIRIGPVTWHAVHTAYVRDRLFCR
jgi:ligand-binding SRPBCC domain-containing protein